MKLLDWIGREGKPRRWPPWAGLWCLLLAGSALWSQSSPESPAEDENAAAQAALERVQRDREARAAASPRSERVAGIPIRRRSMLGSVDPVYRNGVAYFDEWTMRAGAQRLRVPAYEGWQAVKPASRFHAEQARRGVPGEHLALAITNSAYVRATRSKYVNFFGLLWVPQMHAFTQMTGASFADFKAEVRERIVALRQETVQRDDFLDFQDYLDFKLGYDERVDASIDGYLFRAEETEDMVMYFATSEFIYQTERTEIRQPMILTITYALVHGKLLRFDFKRLFTADEEAVQLIAFSRRFVEDMRAVNDLSENKRRY